MSSKNKNIFLNSKSHSFTYIHVRMCALAKKAWNFCNVGRTPRLSREIHSIELTTDRKTLPWAIGVWSHQKI